MIRRRLRSADGFTYLTVLMLVVIMGIMMGATGQTWQMIMKRERERELLFRGRQIRDAIKRWNTQPSGPNQPPVTPLMDLKHLLADPRTPAKVRYLRRLYTDPMTGKDWQLVMYQSGQGIGGVCSSSNERPLKQDFFLPEEREFVGKQKYSDWKFVHWRGTPATGGGTGTGTQPPPGGLPPTEE